jgi:predicted enzyme related to lactoylglutathione lyase
MKVDYVYAAVYVRDIELSESFYSKVLGRAPDDKPMDTLIQWRGFSKAGIQLFKDASKSGNSLMTLVVADVEKVKSSLYEMGIQADQTQQGSFGKIARLSDPDGNVIVLAEPPKASPRQA